MNSAQTSCLILQRERPSSLVEVKRALLTFDVVTLFEPDDRELIPPIAFMRAASGGIMPMGVNVHSVLPLGKAPGFSAEMEVLQEGLRPALSEGAITFITPPPDTNGRLFIGNFPIGDNTPNPTAVLSIFRHLAADPELLRLVVPDETQIAGLSDDHLESLVPPGSGHGSISTLPAPIQYTGHLNDESLREPLSRLGRARLGAVVRGLATAHFNGLQPLTDDPGMSTVLATLTDRFRQLSGHAIDDLEDTRFIDRLSRLHRVVFGEFFDDTELTRMTVADVLRFRNRAWQEVQEVRGRLFETLRQIALTTDDGSAFDHAVRSELRSFSKARESLSHDWTNLRIKVLCEIGGALSTGGAGVLQKFLGLGTIEGLLLFGGVFFTAARSHLPELRDLLRRERDLKSSSGYSLARPYLPLIR